MLGVQLPFSTTDFSMSPRIGKILTGESFMDRKGLGASADIVDMQIAAVAELGAFVYQAEFSG